MNDLDKLEAGVSWSRVNEKHDASVTVHGKDVSAVGRRRGAANDEDQGVEAPHDEFRQTLMTSSLHW